MLVFHRWSIASGLVLLGSLAVLPVARSGEPTTASANCNWWPLRWCVKAPYTCKPEPCAQPLCYEKWCSPYCAKPLPCPPAGCLQWCKDGYCPKPPVCNFPGDPCPPCLPNKHGKK